MNKNKFVQRLRHLDLLEPVQMQDVVLKRGKESLDLNFLNDFLGKAGYYQLAEKQKVIKTTLFIVASNTICISLWALSKKITIGLFFFIAISHLSFCCFAFLLFWKFKKLETERLILFQTPLLLENLLQLVESGLGVLPAIHQIAFSKTGRNIPNYILRLVYEISATNVSFSRALEEVASACENKLLKHVLLHLDISGNEGGELIPSLRSLSDYAQSSWKISVQERLKKLENLVVFPVFVSVLGLLCLLAAVPLQPIIEFMNNNQPKTIHGHANQR